jgi:hypothetical protein
MNWNTIDQRCESTPFVVCETPTGNVRLWRSKRQGNYGYQVYGFAIDIDNCPDVSSDSAGHFYKTDGYGYCKKSSALEYLFRQLGHKPRDMHLGSEGIPHRYRVGGNYYRIPKKDWVKIK